MIKRSDFLLPGGPDGVLLIHGLTGTPVEMRFVAKGLNRAGFTVHAMQLAGHCGSREDLLATGWRDWYASVDQAATALRQRVERLFVGGLSMGAVLALKLAAQRPAHVDGLGLYGTTFRYDGWAIPPLARLSFLLPLVCRVGIGRRRSFMETFPYGIQDERMRQWVVDAMFNGTSDTAGLPGNPWPSLAQFHLLAGRVRRQLGAVRAPCLAVHAADDDIASLRNVRIVEQGVQAPVETLLLDRSYHMITIDRQRDVLVEKSAAFFAGIVSGVAAR